MGFSFVAEAGSAWQPGHYPVTLIGYDESTMQYGDVLTLKYARVDDPNEVITEIVSKKATPLSKLSRRVCALSKITFDQLVGRPFSLDKLIGKQAIAIVTNVTKEGQTFDHIEDLVPVKGDVEPADVGSTSASADASADDDIPW
jgi:hypothetical protein